MAVKLSQGFLWALLIVWSGGHQGREGWKWTQLAGYHLWFHLQMRMPTEVNHLPGSHKSETRPPLGFRPGSL